jgi:hypothetical protein
MSRELMYATTGVIGVVLGTWLLWPVSFAPPPPFGQLQVTTGFAAFQPGRSHRNLVVGGVDLACGYTPSRGATLTCDGQFPLTGVREAKAYWYSHPAKWPHKATNLLMQLEAPPGNVVMPYAAQITKLSLSSSPVAAQKP